MAICNIPAAFGSILMDGDEYVRCRHCGYGGCDLRMQCENGCTCHAVRFLRRLAHLDCCTLNVPIEYELVCAPRFDNRL